MELHINGKAYQLSRLEVYLSSPDLSGYDRDLLSFLAQWLSGQEDFDLQTSGSTGVPQTIRTTRHLLEYSALNTVRYLQLKAGDKSLICLHTHFIAGKMMLIRSLLAQLDMYVVSPNLNPFEIYPHDFDFVAVVPLQLEKWLMEPTYQLRLQRFKKVIVGGAALGGVIKSKCKLLDCEIYETYGMTETLSHIALKNIKKEDCFNLVYDDLLIDVDERSCLKIKGQITEDKWLQTNDMVRLVSKNAFEFVGRADFIINSGGLKINPLEIEEAIGIHYPDLGAIVASSVPDARLGEAMVLVVEGDSVPSLHFDFLEKYRRPRQIILLAKFPLTNSGKIDRKLIKKIIFTP